MYERAGHAHTRFVANLTRIHSLFGVAFARDKDANPNGSSVMEPVSGDLMRAIVVFLHASTEDYIRSQVPRSDRFTYTSGNDITKVLKKNSFDPSSLAPFLTHLASLAERRNRIVHHADLPENGTISDWTVLNTADLFIWLIAVWGFSWQLMAVVTKPHVNFLERATAFSSALLKAVDYKAEVTQMIGAPQVRTEQVVAMNLRLTEIFSTAHPKQQPPEL